jgi:hypothetical protein
MPGISGHVNTWSNSERPFRLRAEQGLDALTLPKLPPPPAESGPAPDQVQSQCMGGGMNKSPPPHIASLTREVTSTGLYVIFPQGTSAISIVYYTVIQVQNI